MLTSIVLSFFGGEDTKKEEDVPASTLPETTFQLPISYCETRELDPVISNDLELIRRTDVSGSETASPLSVYERLFQPTHQFARDTIPQWTKNFTTDQQHLLETQEVIRDMSKFDSLTKINTPYCFGLQDEHCSRVRAVLETVATPNFLEKYNYMEWSFLKPLNESSLFLELLAIGNILSPVASLFLPVIFFLMPFVILKIQGVPLTFEVYLSVLKQVAKNHFIGKALVMGMDSFTMDKILYLIFMFALYLMQIYQNAMAVKRMYENVQKMNRDLIDLRDFCQHTTKNMDVFTELHREKSTYGEFCKDVRTRAEVLVHLRDRLSSITPFSLSFNKLADLGTMLEIYYQIHASGEYQEAIQYAMGFEGYMDNMRGVYRHWNAAHVSMINLIASPPTDVPSTGVRASSTKNRRPRFIKQYYPALLDEPNRVRNTVNLKRNWIITGPNASGKTTLLKSTAINVILTQQLGCGFYGEGSHMSCLYSHIHSYLNIPDTSERDSLFQAEARRCKTIIDAVNDAPQDERHFCIFDELYSGTNPKEASKAAYAFLKFLSVRKNVDYILTTHYVDVCKRLADEAARITNCTDDEGTQLLRQTDCCRRKRVSVCNYKMLVKHDKDSNRFKYTYRVKRGVSTVLGAGQILKDMNYPVEIVGDFHQETD
jgi:MutS domain V